MATSDEVLTKRLIISGLTPSISHTDLQQRFGTFGSVKVVDGVGAVDALGTPFPSAQKCI